MTPMIDVVFLLIVFFTLVINFAAADQNERIKLPVSELAQPPEQPPADPITLNILTDGNVIYNGREYSLEELKEAVDFQVRVLKILNVPLDEVTVILRADAECQSGQVFDVQEMCRSLNLNRFILRAIQVSAEPQS